MIVKINKLERDDSTINTDKEEYNSPPGITDNNEDVILFNQVLELNNSVVKEEDLNSIKSKNRANNDDNSLTEETIASSIIPNICIYVDMPKDMHTHCSKENKLTQISLLGETCVDNCGETCVDNSCFVNNKQPLHDDYIESSDKISTSFVDSSLLNNNSEITDGTVNIALELTGINSNTDHLSTRAQLVAKTIILESSKQVNNNAISLLIKDDNLLQSIRLEKNNNVLNVILTIKPDIDATDIKNLVTDLNLNLSKNLQQEYVISINKSNYEDSGQNSKKKFNDHFLQSDEEDDNK